MNIILLGPPGCGKGTQAEMLSERYSLPHISTGNILRHAIENKTKLGLEAKSFMDQGELVPDKVIDGIVSERLKIRDCNNGFILDGFPRTLEQAKELETIRSIDFVFDFVIPDNLIIQRLSKRRVCADCGSTYHLITKPPAKTGVCDSCNSKLIQREDDSESTIRHRLEIYHKQTEPLIKYYSIERNLITLDGSTPIMKLLDEISDILKT